MKRHIVEGGDRKDDSGISFEEWSVIGGGLAFAEVWKLTNDVWNE